MIRFLGRAWAIYCLIIFTAFMIPSFLIIWIADKIWKDYALLRVHWVLNIWAWGYHILTILYVKWIKKAKLSGTGPYVIVSNHQSMLDIPIATLSLRLPMRFLAKEELTKIPLLGGIIKQLNIPVSRGKASSRKHSFTAMQRSIKRGISVLVFPEGTRNRSKREALMPFYDGAFRLAVEAGVPIIPLTIVDSKRKMTMIGMPSMYPGTVQVMVDEPIDVSGMSVKDVPELRDRVFNLMKQNIEEYAR